jgi:hypothetical protein
MGAAAMRGALSFDISIAHAQVWTMHRSTCNSPACQDAEEAPDLGG